MHVLVKANDKSFVENGVKMGPSKFIVCQHSMPHLL